MKTANASFDRDEIIFQLAQQHAKIKVGAIANRSGKLFAMRLEIEQSVELIGVDIGGNDRLDSVGHVGKLSFRRMQ
ncbi:MAG: hypothetical protein EON84_07670 [Bradyrhizobiaceae bacterium]|nr:MAG: hypothetical protein EON84_07670 [Bradyrhizobiaceae bacterium]